MRPGCGVRFVRGALAAIAWSLVATRGAEARAADTRAQEGDVVELTIAGPPDRELEASLAELFARARLTPRFVHTERPSQPRIDGARGVLAAVGLDLTQPGTIGVVIVDARHATVLTRTVPAENGLDEIAREEISQIVIFSVEAIRRGEVVGSPQPRVTTRPATRHPAPGARLRADLETVASLRTYANVAPAVVGVGAAVGTTARVGGLHVRSLLGFEQRSAIVVATRAASARFEQRSLRVAVAFGLPLGPRLDLTFAGGAAADLVAATTTALRATTEQRRDVTHVVPVLDGAAGVTFALDPRLVLSAAAGAEVPLSTTEYALEGERSVVFLAPDVVRLVGRVGLGVRF